MLLGRRILALAAFGTRPVVARGAGGVILGTDGKPLRDRRGALVTDWSDPRAVILGVDGKPASKDNPPAYERNPAADRVPELGPNDDALPTTATTTTTRKASRPSLPERLDGAWSPYDGTRFESLKESDIEHVVAVSEAHDSGLCGASLAVRARFARDLDNLTLATPRLNRHEKVARDAAEWLPELNRCWFAKTVIAVRQEYGLTIDRREADALDAILAGCE